jgi:(R)-2-hydroxyacyl-CoA dehydratese activating ATPase
VTRVYYMGIDIGSLSCDAVIVDDQDRMVSYTVVPTGARNLEAIARARGEALAKAAIDPSELAGTVATGYGRDRVEGRIASVTEITCHARGIQKLIPGVQVLIDIGGQDSKSIRFDRDGNVSDFAMNDKCAAGTGRFLEAMARALEVDVDQLGGLDNGSSGAVALSSMCTVFAESEVVSLIADGAAVHEIVGALHKAIAARVQVLVKRVAPDVSRLRVAMSGGVARNRGVVRALEAVMQCPIEVPGEPDTVGAYGAALIARERSIMEAGI